MDGDLQTDLRMFCMCEDHPFSQVARAWERLHTITALEHIEERLHMVLCDVGFEPEEGE